jgi:ferredoxin-NADP reductase
MCKNACDRKLSADIVLLYANRTEKDIAFHDDLDGMQAENSSLKIVYTVNEPIDRAAWKGRIGFINSEMVKQEIPDYCRRIFYVCGPPGMVESIRLLLSNDLKLEEQQIKWERFSGYE